MIRTAWPALLLWLLALTPTAFGAAGPGPARELLSDSPIWEVEGYGTDVPSAKRNALKQARVQLVTYLESLYGEISWQPTGEYLLQTGIAHPAGEPREIQSEVVEKAVKVVLQVAVTRNQLRDIQNLIREQRVAERHRLTALGLAGAVVLLLVLMGYLRLDELTKGYYTTALRLLALVLVGAAGAGFLWIIRIANGV